MTDLVLGTTGTPAFVSPGTKRVNSFRRDPLPARGITLDDTPTYPKPYDMRMPRHPATPDARQRSLFHPRVGSFAVGYSPG
jgi:hypothetical protein